MDENRQLEKTYELTKENNEMLKSIRRSQKMTKIFRIGYWVVVIGIAVGAYVFIEPYIGGLIGTYNEALENFNSIR